jgi:hypothetical protein
MINIKPSQALWEPIESNYSVRPTQPLRLKRTFREAGLLTVSSVILLLIQCLTDAFTPSYPYA